MSRGDYWFLVALLALILAHQTGGLWAVLWSVFCVGATTLGIFL